MENFKIRFPKLEAIVFDLDDTLYDRNLFEHGAYREISINFGLVFLLKKLH